MESAGSITIIDADSNDEAWVGVRFDKELVGISMSLRSNGDMKVYMDNKEALELIEILRRAAN